MGTSGSGHAGGHHHHRQPAEPVGVEENDQEETIVVPQVSRSISASHGRPYERANGGSGGLGAQGRNGHNGSSSNGSIGSNGSNGNSGSSNGESTSYRATKKAPQEGNGVHHDNEHTIRMLIDWNWPKCFSFEPKEHLYYHIGHALFLVAFLAPNIPCGFLWLRCAAIAGCILMVLWGWFVACSLDAVVWFSLFLLVNAFYVVVLLCKLRPVKFEKEIESVYVALFKPLRVSRHQFKKVLNCMKIVRPLKYQEIYVQEKITKVDSLSLVLSGKLVVSQNQKALHIVFPHQFLDSPEWFGVSTDDYFQVSIMAMEESRVLIWHRDKLKLSIMAEPFLQAVFDHILGRDVVKKLMQVTQVSETMAQSNGCIASGYGDDSEDKPMLVMKSKGTDNGGHGLTALINRQLQALPRISKYYYCGKLSHNVTSKFSFGSVLHCVCVFSSFTFPSLQ
ncbi:blood vessel epicardial substance isoform X1 [Anopheles gambiae]|uniref:blood vessel epicardial substance isoform X1 n=1 Tax=Anopheles gambiae TaxID=7165 RepID=UPI002AC8B973|nr:blood vessel epicardial substance isoform X1 [Anopheles gambiae]XP_061510457.1 blood vessel epicardial substance isoform X1 [Anopheles gambiae]XP_061510465.1 blood vessel epicardial substance isoform X1 [Anopheles gambiae]XP_061510475.1 blood vessel epicardial substance isoform X1 [Anopheles gambiae]XP_061510486.1 blood vessel epicardial substance isoform X1 [Anopheles gambiae]XP_061510497.1 blood vessel epicardial substance isoform X1 [Anopheles gambiae]XP_061510507.1 blood vessel epicard